MSSTPSVSGAMQWVLRVDAVKAAIQTLQPLPIHESLPAYLHLRRRAKGLGRFTDLQPDWSHEPAEWLSVPGGPPNKPYYRPFTSRGSAFWLNKNLAGSWAPASFRGFTNLYLVPDTREFMLPVDGSGQPDPHPVLSQTLMGKPIPIWALSTFLFRNHVFEQPSSPYSQAVGVSAPGWRDLTEAVVEHFGFTRLEVDTLFTLSYPPMEPFEEFDPDA